MTTQDVINQKLDELESMLTSQQHISSPETVGEVLDVLSALFHLMSDDDRAPFDKWPARAEPATEQPNSDDENYVEICAIHSAQTQVIASETPVHSSEAGPSGRQREAQQSDYWHTPPRAAYNDMDHSVIPDTPDDDEGHTDSWSMETFSPGVWRKPVANPIQPSVVVQNRYTELCQVLQMPRDAVSRFLEEEWQVCESLGFLSLPLRYNKRMTTMDVLRVKELYLLRWRLAREGGRSLHEDIAMINKFMRKFGPIKTRAARPWESRQQTMGRPVNESVECRSSA